MSKITTRNEAIEALRFNHNIYEALRFFVKSKQADTKVLLEGYFSSQQYTKQRSQQISEAIIKYLRSPFEKRTYEKFTNLKIEFPLSLLLILSNVAEEPDYEMLNQWRMGLAQKLITVYQIDDDPSGNILLTAVTNFSLKSIVTLGSALNLTASIQAVQMAKPDILVVDHMLPEYDGIEVMQYFRPLLPDSVFVFRSYGHEQEDIQNEARDAGADSIIQYGPYIPPEEYVNLLLQAYKIRNPHE